MIDAPGRRSQSSRPALQRPSLRRQGRPSSGRSGGLGRVLLALVIGQVGLHATMAGLRMAVPLQALREGRSAWTVGILMSLFAAAPVLLALQSGRMVDRHGYHRPVHLAVALGLAGMVLALGSTALAGTPHLALMGGAALLTGAAANLGMITIQRTAGLAAHSSTERVRVFSWIAIAPAFASVVGPVTAGFMIDASGFRAAYGVLALLPLATLAVSRWVPVEPAAAPARGPATGTFELFATPGMRRLLFVNWLLSMCWDVHAFAVPVLGHERGFSATTIGLVLGSFTLSVSGVRLLVPLLAHRLREVTVVRGAMLGTAAVFLLYPLAPNPAAMVACALALGVTLGAVQPMVLSTLHHMTPPQRHGEALALRSMTINASSTLMPLLFGATGAALGAAMLFWIVGGAVGAGSWAARRLVRT